MEEYRDLMSKTMNDIKSQGVTHSIFGDIFLEDLRKYREEPLATIGMQAFFPLWKQNTSDLINEFLNLGFKTIITCVNEAYLDKSFSGRIIDWNFIKYLPENVDPCGENGEFHTFTFDGAIFKNPVEFEIREIIKKTIRNQKLTEKRTENMFFGFAI